MPDALIIVLRETSTMASPLLSCGICSVELASVLNLERGGSEEFGSTVRVVAEFDPAIDGAEVRHGRSRAKTDWNVL
jgi:hypothetical protein